VAALLAAAIAVSASLVLVTAAANQVAVVAEAGAPAAAILVNATTANAWPANSSATAQAESASAGVMVVMGGTGGGGTGSTSGCNTGSGGSDSANATAAAEWALAAGRFIGAIVACGPGRVLTLWPEAGGSRPVACILGPVARGGVGPRWERHGCATSRSFAERVCVCCGSGHGPSPTQPPWQCCLPRWGGMRLPIPPCSKPSKAWDPQLKNTSIRSSITRT
jgi:hypothetical protein